MKNRCQAFAFKCNLHRYAMRYHNNRNNGDGGDAERVLDVDLHGGGVQVEFSLPVA
jgi:hypothetical protein